MKKLYSKILALGTALSLLTTMTAGLPFTAFAADDTTPTVIIYEGRLLDGSGAAITTSHTLRFSLWKSADWIAGDTQGDGSINTGATNYGQWYEEHTTTPNSKGIFSVKLGSSTPLPTIAFTTHKYIQVDVKVAGALDTTYEIMDPTGDSGADADDRQTIGSSPYSKNTERIDDKEIGTSENNLALLGSGGKWTISQIPGGTNENIYILDADDTGGDVALQFGTTLNERLYWDNAGTKFVFSDDVNIVGNLDVDGIIYTGTGDVPITTTAGNLNGEYIADDTIDEDSIDFGTGAGQISAADLPIADAGSYFDATEIEALLQEFGQEGNERWSTGLVDGGVISDNGGNTIKITAGSGYVNYGANKNVRVTWNETTNQAMVADGDNYVYIDENGSTYISATPSTTSQRIFLGYVFTVEGNTDIGIVAATPLYAGNATYKINSWIQNAVGPIVTSGNLVSEGGTNLTLSIIGGRVYTNLTLVDTTDKTTFYKWHNATDDGWITESYSPNYVNTTQLNDTSLNASTNLTGTSTFTNGSSTVSGAGTSFDTEVVAGDYVYLLGDGYAYKGKVSSVDSATQITLSANYTGAGGAGTGVKDETLVNMTAGHWKKDLIFRTTDDNVHYIYGQTEYATEDLAKEGALPTIPGAILNGGGFMLATIVSQNGDASINNRLYDVRPNFERVFGYGTSGTTGSAADHGSLAGLGDDDHVLYFNVDGSDTMSGNLQMGTNSILNAVLDGDNNTFQDIDWTSLKPRTKKIHVEISDMTIEEDGSDNLANLYIDSDKASQYYLLKTTQTSMQDLTVKIKVKLPEDFVDFRTASTDLSFYYKNTGANNGDSQIDILVTDDDGDEAFRASDGQRLFSTPWTEYRDEFDGANFDPRAGEYIFITVKGYATNDHATYHSPYMGEIVLTYTGR